MKHFLIFLFSFIYAFSCVAYDFEDNGFFFNILSTSDMTVEVASSSTKYTGDIEIPATANFRNQSLKVVKIGQEAFSNCTGLTSVVIPEGVTSIDWEAFYGCKSLCHVTFPQSLERIEDMDVFANCTSLREIDLPENLQYLGGYAFYNTGITTLKLPNNVVGYGHGIFGKCNSLKDITIPRWMKRVGDIFYNCEAIENIYVLDPIPPTSDNYSFFSRDVQLNANVYVLKNSKQEFTSSEQWSKFFSISEDENLGTAYYIDVFCGPNGQIDMLGFTLNGNTNSWSQNTNEKRFGEIEGEEITLQFIPNSNNYKYRLKSLLVNGIEQNESVTDNLYSFVLNENVSINASFVRYYNVIFRSIGEHGQAFINGNVLNDDYKEFQIDEYTPTNIELTVDDGYRATGKFTNGGYFSAFKKVDDTHYILEQPIDTDISFTYSIIHITLHNSCSGNGSLKIDDEHTVDSKSNWMECGTSYFNLVTVEAIPQTGHYLHKLEIGGTDVTSEVKDGCYTFIATKDLYHSDKDQINIHAEFQYGSTGVENVMIDTPSSNYTIYSLSGTILNCKIDELSSGLYVISIDNKTSKLLIR